MKGKNNSLPLLDHFIVELSDLNKDSLLNTDSLINQTRELVNVLGLKIVKETYHNFSPFGTTLIFILSTSHFSLHTWPENNYLHIDLLTCKTGELTDKLLFNVIKRIFKTNKIEVRKISYERQN